MACELTERYANMAPKKKQRFLTLIHFGINDWSLSLLIGTYDLLCLPYLLFVGLVLGEIDQS